MSDTSEADLAAEPDESGDIRLIVGAVAAVLVLVVARPRLVSLFDAGTGREWMTVFVAVSVQAMPFLVLGVVLAGAIAALVSPAALARVLPRNRAAAVVVSGGAGFVLPGCECGAVPIAGRLIGGRVPAAAALTFLLAAPAINPVVLVATATAFPGQPELVGARFVASLLTAITVGLLWLRIGPEGAFDHLIARATRSQGRGETKWQVFTSSATHDLLHAGGWLVVGAAAAATIQAVVPRSVLDAVAEAGFWSILALAILAVVLSVCSEADAFVATSFTAFSPTARLAFMVVGPAVDLKLVALQQGTFGAKVTRIFAPVTFVVAVAWAILAGTVAL